MTDRDTYYNMTKWEWFVEGFRNISYIISCYNASEPLWYRVLESSHTSYDDFWEALSWGWMCEYITPYDDPYNPYISKERKLRLGRW
jgi:hypothetical protein